MYILKNENNQYLEELDPLEFTDKPILAYQVSTIERAKELNKSLKINCIPVQISEIFKTLSHEINKFS